MLLNEYEQHQGISKIKMDNKFLKSEIIPFSSADEKEIKQAYRSGSLDVTEVILKESILATEK